MSSCGKFSRSLADHFFSHNKKFTAFRGLNNERLSRIFYSHAVCFLFQGGKFSVVPLFVNIGSGLALLGIVSWYFLLQSSLGVHELHPFVLQQFSDVYLDCKPLSCSVCFFQATVLCDIVVLYVVKRKSYYREKKYQYVNDPDESGSEVRKLSKRGWGEGCWRWGRLHIFLLNHRRPRARVKGERLCRKERGESSPPFSINLHNLLFCLPLLALGKERRPLAV